MVGLSVGVVGCGGESGACVDRRVSLNGARKDTLQPDNRFFSGLVEILLKVHNG